MTEYKIIAVHRPTGEQHELGSASTAEEAVYIINNDICFDETDVPSEWAFQVIDSNNNIVAYGKTINTVVIGG